jgi:hypothetical protein
MNSNKKEERNLLLGYLAFYETSSHEGYLGAILITDLQGIPQEFRYTQTVKPTVIQKTLYGSSLELYIGVNLCGIPLIQSLANKPSLVLVQKEFLLGVRASISFPVTSIRRAEGDIEVDSTFKGCKMETIDCSTGKFQPIIVSTHHDFGEDLTSIKEFLTKVCVYLYPIEPFERMEKAIREIVE